MFAAGLAHDLKEYCSRIFGHASFLRNSLDPKSVNYRRVADLAETAQEASELVDRLRTFSGKSTFHPTTMSVDAPINETLRVLRRYMRPNIRTDISLDARPGMVKADYLQLQKAVLDILTNACDAMPSGGTLEVGTKQAEVEPKMVRAHPWMKAGLHVVISISDSGMGMSREVLDKIFDPFFTTKGRGKGAGLGLSVAYGIVKDHKGIILARSKVAKGSTFEIYLPAAKT
jgi:signal transduction histidine kinase